MSSGQYEEPYLHYRLRTVDGAVHCTQRGYTSSGIKNALTGHTGSNFLMCQNGTFVVGQYVVSAEPLYAEK